MPHPLIRTLYPVGDRVLGAFGRHHAKEYSLDETIVVASSGRGGSTWLAEIVATLPGKILMWEPLHLANNPECARHGFTWQNYVKPGVRDDRKRAYLERLLRGEELSTRTMTSLHFKPARFFRSTGYIVKFVNVNMMLSWLLQEFPVRAILMVRHPCAVVASQLTHGAWSAVTKEDCTVPEAILGDFPHIEAVFDRIQAPEEILAFEWALQTYVPLSSPLPHPWLLTTYEALVEWREAEVDRLFTHLGEHVPVDAYRQLSTASATTVRDSNVAQGRNPLSGWQRRLSSQQVQNVLRVTHDVGVDFYTEALHPHYERVPGYQSPHTDELTVEGLA